MLKRPYRLTDRRSIQETQRRGRVQRSRHLTVKLLAKSTDQPTQAAVIVSSRVAKQAAARNRLRRRLQAALEKLFLQIPRGQNMLVIVNSRQLLDLKPSELSSELADCLRAAGALPANRTSSV